MQPIERYGLIALLFLVVTVVAVVLWDRGERRADDVLVAAAGAEAAGARTAADPRGSANPREARAQPRSTVGQPPVSGTPLAGQAPPRGASGLAALPTENLPAPGVAAVPGGAVPAGGNPAGPKAAGRASELHGQRAALEWILALSDPAEQDRAVAEFQARMPENALALGEAVRAARASVSPAPSTSSAVAAADTSSPSPLLEVVDPRQRRPQDPTNRGAPGMGLSPMQVGGAAAPKAEGSTYTVQRGDTLGEISQRLLGTSKRIGDIVALNPGLDPNNVPAGRVLRMPVPVAAAPAVAANTAVAPAAASPAVTAPSSTAPTYVVQSGDSLFRIAAKHLGDGKRHAEIAALNPKVDPSRLLPGQRLVLPAASAARPEVAAAAAKPAPATPAKPTSAVASNQKPAPAPRSSSVQ